MINKNRMKPLARLVATSLAVGSMAGFGAQAFAATAAGTLIKNLATVTYQDENGNEYSAQSNEAVVTVAPVASATIENDRSLSASPGQVVYFPHTVSNTGNVADSYKFSLADTSIVSAPVDSYEVFHDLNGNGQPDPGEPLLSATDSLSLSSGEVLNVVVALGIPPSATSGAEFSAKLTATADSGATVIDTGANGDAASNLPGTVDDVATVSIGPILVLNKYSVHNEDANQITYTLTVKNNGTADATNVSIIDALPQADTNGSGSINLGDAQTTLVGAIQVNGLLNSNGDAVPSGVTPSLAGYGDVNHNGISDDTGLNVIVAEDVTLPANTTVTIVYTVSYEPTWASGLDIENTFTAEGDNTDAVSSNTTNDVTPPVYGVSADDTNLNTSVVVGVDDTSNDGKDDDNTDNNLQTVDVAAAGSFVLFNHIIENEGNGDDTFNIDVVSDSFPPNTVFTYWDATGSVQLTDTDDDGVPDTGVLGAGADTTIMVKAKLPAGYTTPSTSPSGTYDATLTATSSGDTSINDTTLLTLKKILIPSVDIVTTYGVGDDAGQGFAPADGFGDAGVDAQDDAPVLVKSGDLGEKVIFNLKLANESGSSDSYTLMAGDDPATIPVETIPAGWDVVFKDTNGNVITTSPLVPGGGEFSYIAEVTISSDPAEALSNAGSGVDGYDAVNDGSTSLTGGDNDEDYQVRFTATSTSSPSLFDTVTNSVDVELKREVVITPNGQNQIQPGGTVDYSHKLENNGNQTEPVELEVSNQQSGWTTIINIDTDNNGIPDAVLNAPAQGSTFNISGVNDAGQTVAIEVTDNDGDGIPELNLEPGENVNFTTTVSAPSNAPLGAVDLSTVKVSEEASTTPLATAEDQTTVIVGQVRLDKTVAVDTDCDSDISDETVKTFSAVAASQVEPGQCVVWNLTATNEGSSTVKNVVISDAVPDYTNMITTSLKFCHGNGCSPDTAGGTASGVYSASNGLIKFFAGNADDYAPADPANGKGGELIPGEQATGQFTVEVQ